MNMSSSDKQKILDSSETTYSRITIYKNGQELAVCTEDDYLQEWKYEDYRYVPEHGFIGQFVERLLDGKFINLPESLNINDCELKVELGVKGPNDATPTYYSLGNFLLTKVSDTDTTGTVSFEACDYTKKFNKVYEDRIQYPCFAAELVDDICDQAGVKPAGSTYSDVVYAYPQISDDELPAGDYSLYDTTSGKYYNFTSTRPIQPHECIYRYHSAYPNRVFHKYIGSDGMASDGAYSATQSTTATGTVLNARRMYTNELSENWNFIINNNQFESDATLRDVAKALAQLAYGCAFIDCDNRLRFKFFKKTTSNVTTYTTIDEDHYYKATKTGDTYGPVDRVLIGMSNVTGENVVNDNVSKTTGTEITLNNTRARQLEVDLGGNCVQNGTPTPSSPVPVNVVSGDNEVVVCGKNLFDTTKYTTTANINVISNTNGTLDLQGISGYYAGLVQEFSVIPNQQYKLSYKATKIDTSSATRTFVRVRDNDNSTNLGDNGAEGNITINFTPPHDKIFIFFSTNGAGNNGHAKFENIQLEKGSTATTYEPYTSQNYPISLGTTELCKISTYQDYIYKDNGNWYLYKAINKVQINSSQMRDLTIRTNDTRVLTNQSIIPTANNDNRDLALLKCNYFEGISSRASDNATKVGIALLNTTGFMISFSSTSSLDTLDKFKTWWTTNNPTIYYVLATPTNTQITDTNLISQLELLKGAISYQGQTNVTQSNSFAPFTLSVGELGEMIAIYDNPLTYTEELRKIALSGSNSLMGLTYTPVSVETTGYPWLYADDYVKVEDIDGATYYTYPFNRTIKYSGYMVSSIDSEAKSIAQTNYAYEGDIDSRLKHTEIIVDKHEGQILLINESVDKVEGDVTGLEDKYSDVLSQVDTANTTITQLSSSVQTIQDSTYSKTEVKQIAEGVGPDGVKVTVVSSAAGTFDINGMHYEKSGAPTKSTINEKGLEVDTTSDSTELLYAGYDADATSDTYGQSIVRTANLTVTNWTVVGTHGRFEAFTDTDDHEGVGFFLV